MRKIEQRVRKVEEKMSQIITCEERAAYKGQTLSHAIIVFSDLKVLGELKQSISLRQQ